LKKTTRLANTSTDADGRDFYTLEVTFQSNNILLPTLEGQYIIKI
jgi:hypothetical protein